MNRNARIFLHPPGIEKDDLEEDNESDEWRSTHSEQSSFETDEHGAAPDVEPQPSPRTTYGE